MWTTFLHCIPSAMRVLLFVFTSVFSLLFAAGAHSDPGVVARYVPQAELVGSSRLSFLFWDVYDATLYAPQARWQPDGPYALAIRYLRDLEGEVIASRSIEEMEGLGLSDEAKQQEWYEQMAAIFPDVEEGVVLTGVRDKSGRTLFYKYDIRLGIVDDPAFADWFFGIWLNEKTSEPDMRERLLGIIDEELALRGKTSEYSLHN